MNNSVKIVATFLGFCLTISAAHAVLSWTPTLPGTVDSDQWDTDDDRYSPLGSGNNPGYGSFPGKGAWPKPIESTAGGNANLMKIADGPGGGPYPASAGLYFGSFGAGVNADGGHLRVSDPAALAGVATVIFVLEISESFGNYAFYNNVLPTLSYNGGNQAIAAKYSSTYERIYNGTMEMPPGSGIQEPIYIDSIALQWDLSSLTGINSFAIDFNGVEHAGLRDIALYQSSAKVSESILPAPVPEPSVLFLAPLGLLYFSRRRR